VAAGATLSAIALVTGVNGPQVAALPARPSGDTDTRTYIIPGEEIFAEGVAVQGDRFYVTSVGTGRVYRGELDEREAKVFIPEDGWGPAEGIKVTGGRLLVARGYGGNVALYNRKSGAFVARWSNWIGKPDPGVTNVNDIAIAPNGDAYITDSDRPVLYRIPVAELQNPGTALRELPVFLDWTSTPFPHMSGNGIVATPDGKYVIVVNFGETGGLFRVRLSDKQVTQVDLGGYGSTGGGDGMVLTDDNVLYVVRIFDSLVAKLRLNPKYDRGRLLSETSDPTFHGPTTAAIAGNRLLVVNSQFTGPPSAPPWTVSSIRLP
jgi:Cu-Zn family superoxide dismutase